MGGSSVAYWVCDNPGSNWCEGLAGHGHTNMRKDFPGLSLMVQEALKRDPMCGHLIVFRGRGGLIKVIWHDGQGVRLF